MRIVVDGSCWTNRRGFGRFTRSLVTEMAATTAHRLVIVIDEPSLAEADLPPSAEVVRVRVRQPPSRAASAAGRRSLPDLARMSLAARRTNGDAFFFPATYTYYPVFATPTVVTVHDATPEKAPDLVFPDRRARLQWELKQRAALRRASTVVTVSSSAKEDIAGYLGVPEERIAVIREAPAPVFQPMPEGRRTPALQRAGLRPRDRYLLYAGGISPHKSLDVLVRAFEQVASAREDVRLVIVGDTTEDPFLSSTDTLRALVAASPAGPRVVLTGYVPDDDLVALYGGAVATALPSRSEGFGLTAAESAACGTPVVASDLPALRELLGDVGLYAPVGDAAAFAAALGRLLDDPNRRAALSEACLRRAAGWSWTAAAQRVTSILEQVAAGG